MREQWGPGVASLSEAAAPGWSLKQRGMSFPVPWKTCWKKFSYHLSFLLKLCASKQIYLLLCITVVQKRNKFSGEKHRTVSWTGVRQEVTRWWSWVHWLYDHVRVISKEMKRNIISFPFGPWGWSTRNRQTGFSGFTSFLPISHFLCDLFLLTEQETYPWLALLRQADKSLPSVKRLRSFFTHRVWAIVDRRAQSLTGGCVRRQMCVPFRQRWTRTELGSHWQVT